MQASYRQIQAMGTRLDIVVPDIEEVKFGQLMSVVSSEVGRIERMLSYFDSTSEISLINAIGFAGPVALEAELGSIFRELKAYHEETGGYFDPTLRPVYDFHRSKIKGKNSAEQSDSEKSEDIVIPDELRAKVGMDKVMLGPEGISFLQEGMKIDLGGYGKGYAIKCLLPIFEEYDIARALISFGESLVYGLGSHPFGPVWKVSIPFSGSGETAEFELKDLALSTSGNSLNNQKKFANSGHIVNPVTLQMKEKQGLVSVKSADPVRAEVYSTALFSAGSESMEAIVENAPDLEVLWSQ